MIAVLKRYRRDDRALHPQSVVLTEQGVAAPEIAVIRCRRLQPMAREPEPERSDDDELEDEEPPRVRPVRMVVASVFGILAAVGTLMCWFALHPSEPPPEPKGDAAIALQGFVPLISWIGLMVCGLVAVVSAITLIMALLEARAARDFQC